MKKLATFSLAMGMVLSGASFTAAAAQETAAEAKSEAVKVVYHINNAQDQALAGLRNIRNHLDTAPGTKIVVVTHSLGVDFLMSDYKDAEKVGPLVSALAARGVEFDVCRITLKNRNLSEDAFVLEANFVPSGVVRMAELQAKEGYAYIKP